MQATRFTQIVKNSNDNNNNISFFFKEMWL